MALQSVEGCELRPKRGGRAAWRGLRGGGRRSAWPAREWREASSASLDWQESSPTTGLVATILQSRGQSRALCVCEPSKAKDATIAAHLQKLFLLAPPPAPTSRLNLPFPHTPLSPPPLPPALLSPLPPFHHTPHLDPARPSLASALKTPPHSSTAARHTSTRRLSARPGGWAAHSAPRTPPHSGQTLVPRCPPQPSREAGRQ
eukprot:235980-Chlamydomonas_euryale.AAC.2